MAVDKGTDRIEKKKGMVWERMSRTKKWPGAPSNSTRIMYCQLIWVSLTDQSLNTVLVSLAL